MAKALGVQVITSSSTVGMAKRLVPYVEQHKLTVALHNQGDARDPNLFTRPESLDEVLKMSRQFAVNLDLAQFTAAGFDPVAYLKENHKRVSNIHVQGDSPSTKPVLGLLKKEKYPIPAHIECDFRGADPAAGVRRCLEFCRSALA